VHWKETDAAGKRLNANRPKDPGAESIFGAAAYIVSRAKHQDLVLHYNIPTFQPGDVSAFLGGVARARGRIRKV
jgi:hypothetical protein